MYSRIALSLIFAAVLPVYGADLPSGGSIMDLSLERSGGTAAFSKIKSLSMTGTVELVGHNLSGPLQIFQQGEKSYTVIDLPGIGKVEEGFDGKTAWENNALQGPRIKDGEEKAVATRASRMNLMSTWRDFYKDARTLGEEDVAGKPAWKVELTPVEGRPETFYFDKDSGLLVRIVQTVASALGDIPVDVTLSDYRTIGGVKTPFAMTQHAMSQVMAMKFDKVEWNPVVPEDRFDPPAAIKALIERKKP